MGIVVATPLERGLLATGVAALRPEDHINRHFTPEVLHHVEQLEALCQRHGVSLLAAALQFVVRDPAVSTTVPGARRPEPARGVRSRRPVRIPC